MKNPFAERLAQLKIPNYKRLKFEEQCAVYAALKCGVPPLAVAAAAGIGASSISLLSSAGEFRAGQWRYLAVGDEYRALGHEAFVAKYLTAPFQDRCMTEIDALARREPRARIRKTDRPDRFAGRHALPMEGEDSTFVVWIARDPDSLGYAWKHLNPWGRAELTPDEAPWRPHSAGNPARDVYPTSRAALDAIKAKLS